MVIVRQLIVTVSCEFCLKLSHHTQLALMCFKFISWKFYRVIISMKNSKIGVRIKYIGYGRLRNFLVTVKSTGNLQT